MGLAFQIGALAPIVAVGLALIGRLPRQKLQDLPVPQDKPVGALMVFQRTGRIHERPSELSIPDRVYSFEDAQDRVLSMITGKNMSPSTLSLRLCAMTPFWTDVLVEGDVIVQVPTAVLTGRSAGRYRQDHWSGA
ncbi:MULTISPECIES: hypothetical protein [Marivita]|uniref:Uncharacterized protein n=1 Tax=Marivita cryptomonadis TaxID=505252 RepID=A0A9Q2NRY0_9RHOB|nr:MULTISPECIES: hypothetical protein [Marivita]MCR9168979.1 hypothetical protein [Paracoccaceae bacterium]MBM2321590.1 hypothetical protein [Marivita cryptomonadis]MBM2331171.1 hypothetical protein [Marivita cryptomonadis]MBM2340757.1 hypothetical protein [Marivita cryptomonadis]MBM2345419.1 hypothetical protein [Marivita cryptomonadis]